jgi:hypothetical protein
MKFRKARLKQAKMDKKMKRRAKKDAYIEKNTNQDF